MALHKLEKGKPTRAEAIGLVGSEGVSGGGGSVGGGNDGIRGGRPGGSEDGRSELVRQDG